MNCSNCGAEFSVGAETHLLNCAFCGTVQRNEESADRRPIDDLLDKVFAETGDAASILAAATPVEIQVEPIAPAPVPSLVAPHAAPDAGPPVTDPRQAMRDTRRALNDVFGDDGGPASRRARSAVAVAEPPAPSAQPATGAQLSTALPAFDEPVVQRQGSRPQITLSARDDHPEWTRYLVPFLVLSLLGGLGVAALTAALLR